MILISEAGRAVNFTMLLPLLDHNAKIGAAASRWVHR